MQGLEAVAVHSEPSSQPVKQVGMGWPAAAGPEVARGLDNSPAEMVVPDAVDNHSREERILRRGHPGGERPAALGIA